MTAAINDTDDLFELERKESNERLERAEGVLLEPGAGRRVGCDPTQEACAPDDYSADPHSASHVGPGTVDDLPLTFGQEILDPADQHLIPNHAPLRKGECREDDAAREDNGMLDESELWDAQRHLVEEDERTGVRVEGMSEDRVPAVLDAMGDDAADALPDAPGGTSATGSREE